MKNQSGLKNPLASVMRRLQAEPHNPTAAVECPAPSPPAIHYPAVFTSESDTCTPTALGGKPPTETPEASALDRGPAEWATGSPSAQTRRPPQTGRGSVVTRPVWTGAAV